MATILHVDDDEPTLKMVGRFLEGRGFRVISTTSPFIAPIISKERPDLVVMDVDMPLLPGDRIISILRGNEYSSLPVIYFSGKPAAALAPLAERSLPAAFVVKSQGLPALLEKVLSFVRP